MKKLILAFLAFVSFSAFANDPIETGRFNNKAIYGYDPIAYWTQNAPAKGSDEFVYTWRGAEWHFVSEENLNTFKSDPEKYAPQYGGHCAFGMARGSFVSIDEEAFTIYDGKLYLNYSKSVAKKWRANKDEFIANADKNYADKVELPQ